MKIFKTFYREMRVVMPHELSGYIVAAWVLFNAMLLAGVYFFDASFSMPSKLDPVAIINGFIAAAYSTIRASRFHPLTRADYYDWLVTQPWRRGQPLPDGPVLFCWQDAVVLFLCIFPMVLVGRSPAIVFLLFLLPYVFAWTYINSKTEQYVAVFFVLLLLPLALYGRSNPWIALVVLPLTTAIAAWGIWRGLADFPWDGEERGHDFEIVIQETYADPEAMGWPQGVLLDEKALTTRSFWSMAAISLVTGVWAAIVVAMLLWLDRTDRDEEVMAKMATFATIWIAGTRLVRDIRNTGSPMNLLGRIRTGRLIIPRYDYVFIAPLFIFIVGTTLLSVLRYTFSFPIEWTIGASIGAVLLLSMAFPPTLRNWRLTGHHRLKPGMRSKLMFDTL